MQLPPDTKWPEPFSSLIELGQTEANFRGMAKMMLRVFELYSISVNDEQRARVLACRDEAKFDEWVRRVIVARTADEVFE